MNAYLLYSTHFKFVKIAIIMLLFCCMAACTKQVAGPKGDPGEPAPQGNLKQSKVFVLSVDSSDWNVEKGVWVTTIFMEDLKYGNAKSFQVNVYMEMDAVWWCLPYSETDIFTQFSIADRVLRLSRYKLHGAPGSRPSKARFRIVVLSTA